MTVHTLPPQAAAAAAARQGLADQVVVWAGADASRRVAHKVVGQGKCGTYAAQDSTQEEWNSTTLTPTRNRPMHYGCMTYES